ncbi:MAG: UDP-N-acetylmuramoyl-tripeptide-D-alanyl-D-alanine ligase [Candidatus Magasanikbacteria bacterium GW2011_GWC2_40_17]|uniref:UDP-N-acetylmuramoyl-tripeptide-D-alanyl-D-alanine ligase n=1 Tax=Candidatus Magasanikbacteria bacterium GW2011_GWA2_42_32 TaxID=1619039 RepID=A0A0G1CFT4_9BACT|nr:MAG: UDP-N-acetylmuramoyl-tripeptide-D-alanyl-D-alanine ligase [Candidatus Magasanikbacteria bacterium GW2011_GWC2_40_17]KKS57431.1 MAG: UDP-N-acetylmuramoyl-tripeptide-D-alanyl-D-alanine ligase [Candidatus Magasanikbacteria bacterium GW2011_GWA2_42_32]OGH85577.1 MAG: hypothetical protein A2294_01710 [Candidatus Magasanikbacteria bacterium RIFOXYB2_FULL_38_10]
MFLLQNILKILAQKILAKYHPKIIGITGSVGKTSAKEAIFLGLDGKFKVRRSLKNYNNEIGVPLTIIGTESGNKNPWIWLKIFSRAVFLLIKKNTSYPEILILEMGADKPGDIKYLTKIAPCDIGVLTAIGPTHLENFKTMRQVTEEKQIILKHLRGEGLAVFNFDDPLVIEMKERLKVKTISFGFNKGADLQAEQLSLVQEMEDGLMTIKGLTFKVRYGGALVPFVLNETIGDQAVYAVLAGVAVCLSLGINLLELSEKFKKYVSPPSRMRLISGIKYTTLIDDSYNSSPKAALVSLEALAQLKIEDHGRKIAVLGDMLELGSYTEEGHRLVGRKVAESNVDFLVTVGERAKDIAEEAAKLGMSDNKIAKFNKSEEAGLFLQEKLQIGDVVLIKGSQGVRMEKITVELMSEPTQAENLVCRQDKSWQKQ